MRAERLTAEEVREFAPTMDKPMVCECDDDSYTAAGMGNVRIVSIYGNRFSYISASDVLYTSSTGILRHYPSQRPEKREVKPLTRSELIKSSDVVWLDSGLNELERLGVTLPDPPEPKKLTVIEAAAEIGKGNRVKDKYLSVYPNRRGYISLSENMKPYTLAEPPKKTIEIDVEKEWDELADKHNEIIKEIHNFVSSKLGFEVSDDQ